VLDTNGNGLVSEEEIKNAERILEKAKQEKNVKVQRQALYDFEIEKDDMNNIDGK
jgi:hypothetical protein